MDDGRQGSRGEQLSDRIGAGAGQRSRWPRRVGHQVPRESVEQQVAALVQTGSQLRVGDVFGSEVEGVQLAGGGAEPDGGILLVPPQGGRRLRGGVAGQHLLAQPGSCPRTKRIGPDCCVRVSVLDQ
jgi:hypothetical protein